MIPHTEKRVRCVRLKSVSVRVHEAWHQLLFQAGWRTTISFAGSNVRRVHVGRRGVPVCVHVRNVKLSRAVSFSGRLPRRLSSRRSHSYSLLGITPISRSTRYFAGYYALIPTIPIFFERWGIRCTILSKEWLSRNSE